MDDLIKRLRRCSAGLDGYETDQGDYGVLNEAAAALAEAQAEIARLRGLLLTDADFMDQMHHARMQSLGRDPAKYASELSMQRDRIRAALEAKTPAKG